jgi:hypothetical protein
MQVLTDKALQTVMEVLVLHVEIERERRKVVVSFHLPQVEEDQATGMAEEQAISTAALLV